MCGYANVRMYEGLQQKLTDHPHIRTLVNSHIKLVFLILHHEDRIGSAKLSYR